MAIFAEKLKSYIEKSGQTIYMVAQSSGVNRTLIHRMTTGARIPSKKKLLLLLPNHFYYHLQTQMIY